MCRLQLRFLGASTMRLTLDSTTNPAVAFYEYVSEPGVTGAPQHIHHCHDETFYIVKGTYEFTIGAGSELLPGWGLPLRSQRDAAHLPQRRNRSRSHGRHLHTRQVR